ncbi:hypothetical protein [Streptomyces sp. NPDC086182]|jgi:hypothetical protein|uniref:hypothetical protein n=1 Tax=Streptomyces sp. NPDC086182 TaxID=3155058 RepID=UPI0034324873
MKNKRRVAAVSGGAAALMLVLAPTAEANWSSSITAARPGFESRRWDDQSYSQIKFTDCTDNSITGEASYTDVQVWRDISLNPDDSYDKKRFTNCFRGANTSNGEWTDLPSSTVSVYFKIMAVTGATSADFGVHLNVASLSVDTTKAD